MNAIVRKSKLVTEPTATFEKITPDLAEFYLLSNTNNRPVRIHHVEALARDMKGGSYQVNGDAIRFSSDGALLDGQHRLKAIVMSGVTLNILVIRGLAPETMKTIDAGVKRTTGDRFALSGVKNGNILAATLNVMNGLAAGAEKRTLTASEAYKALELHPEVELSVAAANGMKIVAASYLAALHYVGHFTGYGAQADEFVQIFKTGYADSQYDPARVARERMISIRSNGQATSRAEQLEILTSAWENKRLGREVKVSRARSGENRMRIHKWDNDAMWGRQGTFI